MEKRRRTKQLNLRLTEKELRRFKRVARHYDLSLAAMVRGLVRDEAIAIKRANAS